MSSDFIAGHIFRDTPHGRACSCGRRWADIASAGREDVGQPDIAHVGSLSEREVDEIQAEKLRVWETVVGVASGR